MTEPNHNTAGNQPGGGGGDPSASAAAASSASPPFVNGGQNLFHIVPSPAAGWSPAMAVASSTTSSRRPPRRFFEGGDGAGVGVGSTRKHHGDPQQQPQPMWSKEEYLSSFPTGPTNTANQNERDGEEQEMTESNSNNNNQTNDNDDNNQKQKSTANSDVVDGIDTSVLREMTKNAFGTATVSPLPSTAVFYASLLYSKTNSHPDCFLYAQALSRNGESKRCVRLLEQAGLLDPPMFHNNGNNNNSNVANAGLYLEAVLLAAEALATLVEWQSVLELLEDACNSSWAAQNDNNHNANNTHPHQQPHPLEDEDDLAWQHFHKSATPAKQQQHDGYIHPVSRLCLWRGRAYAETGHPQRAALYWKRAIQMDPKCVQALDLLLERSVVTPREAFAVITNLRMEPSMEWLRLLYLARIDLSPQDDSQTVMAAADATPQPPPRTASAAAGPHDNSMMVTPKTPFGMTMNPEDHPYLDASSIHLTSPFMMATPANNPVNATNPNNASNLRGILSTGGGTHNHNNNSKTNAAVHFDYSTTAEDRDKATSTGNNKKSTILQSVDDAFSKLWHVHKLDQSPAVLAMAARRAFRRYDLNSSYAHCQHLEVIDPLCQAAGYVYIATLAALGHKRHLFRLAHEWVAASPKSARAWFAVGSYYYCCERFHVAQRHFCRATRLDPHCTEAWIAFGCSFAACDESDQALASFRAAQRISPGEYASLLYMGMEYLRTNHLVLAQYFLNAACKASGGDPLCLNELGVLAMHRNDYTGAIRWFSRALGACVNHSGGNQDEVQKSVAECIQLCQEKHWEATIFNLGQCYRKTRRFSEAEQCFERCIALSPEKCSGYAALGFTKHLMGNLDEAIDSYHQALGCKPEDPFSTEMLNKALQEALSTSFSPEDENTMPKHHNLHPGASNTPYRFGNESSIDHDQSSLSKDYTGNSMMSDDGANLSVESDVDMSLA